ncbi:hypothetical protein KUV23_10805 [Algoriphagus marincola]|uniref:Yip1 domain-containing protein n=1 Tax=Algoriphagus marincola TaxID=264027 RepID=A0ABS7N553_9BACT|nr:hypothetical protein [Algoriphagus marincola]MBY5951465.1 hypothetical protein [Algoriphagus marincola]
MKVLLIIYFIFYVLFYFLIDYVVLNDLVLYEFYSDRFSESRVYELLDFRKEWLWVTYPIKLLIQLIALQIPAMLIYLGLYLAKYEISYKKVFGIVLISEFIFFIPLFIKIIWFSYHPVSMEAVRLFAPLSLFSLFDAESLQEWLFYPFKVLNVFEVVYWILLAFLLAKCLKSSLDSMLKIVLGYYVSFLFCWVVFVMFISLGNS